RRHADVEDRDVGQLGRGEGENRFRDACLADDVDTRLREKPHEPLPEQHRVVGDHDSLAGAKAAWPADCVCFAMSASASRSLPRSPDGCYILRALRLASADLP